MSMLKSRRIPKVELRLYRVIYEALDDLKAALEGMLEPIYKESVQAEPKCVIYSIFRKWEW